jgi:hypothetical protein
MHNSIPPHAQGFGGQPLHPDYVKSLPFSERIRVDPAYKLKWRGRIAFVLAIAGMLLTSAIILSSIAAYQVATSEPVKKVIGAAKGAAELAANEAVIEVEREKKAQEQRAKNPNAATDPKVPTAKDAMIQLAIEAAKAEIKE